MDYDYATEHEAGTMNYMPPQGFPDPFPLMFSPPPDNDEGVVMTLWADMGNGQTVTLCFGPRTFATLAGQATELCRQIGLARSTKGQQDE